MKVEDYIVKNILLIPVTIAIAVKRRVIPKTKE